MKESSKRKISRRQVLKYGTIGIVAVAAIKATEKVKAADNKIPAKRLGMVIDLRKCTACHACSVACKSEFGVPLGVFKSWVKIEEKGRFPNVRKVFLPRLCNHCANPPCVPVCPTNATYAREDGTVVIDDNICIGCKACVSACPYNSRFINPVKRKADKCDFCLHRVENGVVPACLNTCPAKTRIFGDLDDPESEASKILKKNATQVLKPELGTDPQVYYILPRGARSLA